MSLRSHRRHNPLLDEWVLVSPNRTQRPWQGREEVPTEVGRPDYDANCYLCPGNMRANGESNPNYESTYVFENDFPALSHLGGAGSASGECRVICFSPDHSLTLAKMAVEEIEQVVQTWQRQFADLARTYSWVQMFENHGAQMGASNPHPHGQIWATDYVPTIPAKEDHYQESYLAEHGSPLLVDYLQKEQLDGERVVLQTDHWAWIVPFWATWPFEILLLPKRHVPTFESLTEAECADLARILKAGLSGYDALFGVDFPYSMGWHCPPYASDHWQLHAHFYPPLLRSASVQKFMVGFEMLAEPQRDITPEEAAMRLRAGTPA